MASAGISEADISIDRLTGRHCTCSEPPTAGAQLQPSANAVAVNGEAHLTRSEVTQFVWEVQRFVQLVPRKEASKRLRVIEKILRLSGSENF